jgi:hypothetical protein
MRDGKETNKANGRNTVGPNNIWPASLVLIGVYSNKRCTNNSECIDRYRQELCVGLGVPKTEDDAGCSRRKAIDGDGVALSSGQTVTQCKSWRQ